MESSSKYKPNAVQSQKQLFIHEGQIGMKLLLKKNNI
jgi:hypothetical protein